MKTARIIKEIIYEDIEVDEDREHVNVVAKYFAPGQLECVKLFSYRIDGEPIKIGMTDRAKKDLYLLHMSFIDKLRFLFGINK